MTRRTASTRRRRRDAGTGKGADDGAEIGYDYLVLCCGVTANYFGIPGAAEHAWTVYTRKAAIEVRDRMLGSAATIWATGVKVHDQVAGWGLPQGRGGRIQVAPDMRVVGHPELFAVGDVAASVDGTLPQLAQPAIQGGRHAAVVQLPRGVKLRGRVAGLAWVGLHIVMLVGHRNRLATLANLSVRYLAWPGRLNVIMGDPP